MVHHGRASGKVPDNWLKKLDPQVIVVGEAPSEHLDYYAGYDTLTQEPDRRHLVRLPDRQSAHLRERRRVLRRLPPSRRL